MRSHELLSRTCELVVGPAPDPYLMHVVLARRGAASTAEAAVAARPRVDVVDGAASEQRALSLVGRRPALRASAVAAVEALGEAERAARDALSARAVKDAIRGLEAPSSWIVAFARDQHMASVRAHLDERLRASGGEVTKLGAAEAGLLARELADGLAGPYRDRLTLKATLLGLSGPSIVGYAASFFPSQLSVFVGVLGGMVAGPLMFPLSYRFSAVIKRWICSSAELPDVRKDTPFQERMARYVHLQNQIFKDPPRDGIYILKDFTLFVSALLTDLDQQDDRDAHDTIARVVLLCREAFPHVEIDKDVAKIFGNRLRRRFGTPEAQAQIRRILADEAPAHLIPLADAERLLDTLFRT